MKAIKIGGIADHINILLSLPSTIAISKALQCIKGSSSKWIHETFPNSQNFAWQEGYGAFSVSVSGIEETVAYIENQAEHHRKRTFQEELKAILHKHGIAYDARMLD